MKGFLLTAVHRRDMLRVTIAGTAIAATGKLASEAVAAEPTGSACMAGVKVAFVFDHQLNRCEPRDELVECSHWN